MTSLSIWDLDVRDIYVQAGCLELGEGRTSLGTSCMFVMNSVEALSREELISTQNHCKHQMVEFCIGQGIVVRLDVCAGNI